MVTTSKIFVTVAKCEWTFTSRVKIGFCTKLLVRLPPRKHKCKSCLYECRESGFLQISITLITVTTNCFSNSVFMKQILPAKRPGRTKRSSVEPSYSVVDWFDGWNSSLDGLITKIPGWSLEVQASVYTVSTGWKPEKHNKLVKHEFQRGSMVTKTKTSTTQNNMCNESKRSTILFVSEKHLGFENVFRHLCSNFVRPQLII